MTNWAIARANSTAFVVHDLQAGYVELGTELLGAGQVSYNARTDSKICELLGVSIELTDPRRALPRGVGRKLNPAIGAAEALQLIGGWSDPEWMCRVAPNMARFTDDAGHGRYFHGAYGPRLKDQIPKAIDRLRRDPTSRQAVVTIWDPARDGADGPADLPCTTMLQWMIRGGRLHAFTWMRSNDFWWGLAYDAFQFTQLQITIARLLQMDLGSYHHHVGSFHAYERDWANILALHAPASDAPGPDVGLGLWRPGDSDWWDVRARTDDVRWADCDEPAWYVNTLRRFRDA